MLRKRFLFLAPMLISIFSIAAKCADTTPPSATAPAGTIENTSTTEEGKSNFWVVRTASDAVAIHVDSRPFPKRLEGTLLYYPLNELAGVYEPANLTVLGEGTPLPSISVVLTERGAPVGYKIYDMTYTSTGGGSINVGTIRYSPGKSGRSSSDVTIRFNQANLTTFATTRRNPCDEPLTDDMGEEEELELSDTGAALPTKPAGTP